MKTFFYSFLLMPLLVNYSDTTVKPNELARCNTQSIEICFSDWYTETVIDVMPSMFDYWCEGQDTKTVVITNQDTIAKIDSLYNIEPEIMDYTIDTRCRLIFYSKCEDVLSIDTIYMGFFNTYSLREGRMQKTSPALRDLIEHIME